MLQPIKIAILAMGGEGGGVLADWIVALGEAHGFFAQTTSVPGVAQRTGATIYYVELFPRQDESHERIPVLALMPMPGDVDIVLASELMEAGRSVQRGFVTPEKTTLIASTHRVYSIKEKSAMGDGLVDSQALLRCSAQAARRFIHFDMAQIAEQNNSVISAVLFGALCGAGVLPFSREQFEQTIVTGGVGVGTSLKAFAGGYDEVVREEQVHDEAVAFTLPVPETPKVASLLRRVKKDVPESEHYLVCEGIRRLIDYQDIRYAELYLDRLTTRFNRKGFNDSLLRQHLARYLALWMSYEDTIRVADLKTRQSRFLRVSKEVNLQNGQLLNISEFMHPRIEEICETLPVGLGRWLLKPHWLNSLLKKVTGNGRVMRTSSLRGFMPLYLLSRWRRGRRHTLRYQMENERIETWLQRIENIAVVNPSLASEVIQCQRLVKGYSETHARGLKNFHTLMGIVDRYGHRLAPASLRELREAALADEQGEALRQCQFRLALE